MPFVAEECFTIGRVAYTQKDYYHTSLWMEKSLEKEEREINKTTSRTNILDYLAYSNLMVWSKILFTYLVKYF